jgi:hypothetical protein
MTIKWISSVHAKINGSIHVYIEFDDNKWFIYTDNIPSTDFEDNSFKSKYDAQDFAEKQAEKIVSIELEKITDQSYDDDDDDLSWEDIHRMRKELIAKNPSASAKYAYKNMFPHILKREYENVFTNKNA